MAVARIGHCVGCRTFGRLGGPEGDACERCLTSHQRGHRWLVLVRRVRSEPAFAAQVYDALPEAWRSHFIRIFGRPEVQDVGSEDSWG
jgi:hypothetical protein